MPSISKLQHPANANMRPYEQWQQLNELFKQILWILNATLRDVSSEIEDDKKCKKQKLHENLRCCSDPQRHEKYIKKSFAKTWFVFLLPRRFSLFLLIYSSFLHLILIKVPEKLKMFSSFFLQLTLPRCLRAVSLSLPFESHGNKRSSVVVHKQMMFG